jgi:hypothetical protein
MTHDPALEALPNKDRVFARDELDARNSDKRPETYDEVVARLYNDPDLEFYTESLAGLHDTFARPINLDYDLMPGGEITPEDVKKKVGDARAKLMQVSTTALVLFSGHCTSAV